MAQVTTPRVVAPLVDASGLVVGELVDFGEPGRLRVHYLGRALTLEGDHLLEESEGPLPPISEQDW